MRKLLKFLSNKIVITAFFFLLEIAILSFLIVVVTQYSIWVYISLKILSLIVVIVVMSRDSNPAYKLALIIPMLMFSLLGGVIYIFMGRPRTSRRVRRKMASAGETANELMDHTSAYIKESIVETDPEFQKLSDYILRDSRFPVYPNGGTVYYKTGEAYFEGLKEELRKAERFIFMEYFIIGPGVFWDDISTILIDKARQGVDVRIIYDDVGSLFTLPRREKKRLTAGGIKLMAFNKLTPSFDIRLNNRTHRKITVIDGSVAFTGGINLADEYINAVQPFGHWKDTGIKTEGMAVWSFTVMFLSFWSIVHDLEPDYTRYSPAIAEEPAEEAGYIQPLSDRPGQNLQLLENTFIQIINDAKKYVYINTPYLILDNEISSMLCLAAKSGVDVRIALPHIPDKRTIFMMTRSFYAQLIAAGVKIYEYTPGFIHAKSVVSDDKVAYVGSCNMDYRSFYLHFECGAVLYDCPCIEEIKTDYLETLTLCEEISLKKARGANIFVRLARSILRIFAPLL